MSDTTPYDPGDAGEAGSLQQAPGAPQCFRTVRPAPDAVILLWSSPEDNSQQGYVLSKRLEGDSDYEVLAELSRDAASYIDTFVEQSCPAEYRLAAFNEAGEGPPVYSDAREAERVHSSTLGAPVLRCTPVPPRSDFLQWTPKAGDAPPGYVLQRLENGGWFTVAQGTGGFTQHTDTPPVTEGPTFTYRVLPYDSGGYGTTSNQCTVRP